jgi:hypothetical protein
MRIHLLDSGAIVRELAENRLPETTRATYLALGWIIYIVTAYSTLIYSNASRSWIGVFEFASVLAVAVWGFVYAYASNGGKDGRDFVVRFTCLLVPASIKAQVFVWGAYYVLGWGFRTLLPEISFSTQVRADQFIEITRYLPVVMTYLATVASQLVLFLIIAHDLKRIRLSLPTSGSTRSDLGQAQTSSSSPHSSVPTLLEQIQLIGRSDDGRLRRGQGK